nr:MAG TPA: hypothetical protein [Caudoviricetes sp.]
MSRPCCSRGGTCNRYLVNRLICYAYSLSSAPGIVHARF